MKCLDDEPNQRVGLIVSLDAYCEANDFVYAFILLPGRFKSG